MIVFAALYFTKSEYGLHLERDTLILVFGLIVFKVSYDFVSNISIIFTLFIDNLTNQSKERPHFWNTGICLYLDFFQNFIDKDAYQIECDSHAPTEIADRKRM